MIVKIYKKDNTVIQNNDVHDIEQLYDRIRHKDFLYIRYYDGGSPILIALEDIEEIKVRGD